MFRIAMLAALLAPIFGPSLAAPAGQAAVVGGLIGDWVGRGTLLGQPATFEMRWSLTLEGRFVQLEFANAFAAANEGEPAQPVLRALALYRIAADGSAARGTWFDTRGLALPLTSTLESDRLITHWGDAETERGRTTYLVLGPDAIEVIDEVERDGALVEFGRARYRRAGS